MRVKMSWRRNWWKGEFSKPDFFLSVMVRKRAGKSLKVSWAAGWAEGRRNACSPGHGQSSCPWLLGAVCFSRVESESCINLEHSEQKDTRQNEEGWQNFTPKACQGRTSWLYIVCAKTILWRHTLWSSNQLFSIHCIINRNKISDAVLSSLKADLF